MIKSLNKAYQTDSMYYWCNAEGEVNYPGSGFSTGDSERLPAAVKELYEHYQSSPGCDANLYTVTYSGEDGMLLTTMFNSNWMDVPAVKDAKQKARKALRSIATELTRQCKPWGTVLFGEDTDPEGDEIALFVPAQECASHFEEAVKSSSMPAPSLSESGTRLRNAAILCSLIARMCATRRATSPSSCPRMLTRWMNPRRATGRTAVVPCSSWTYTQPQGRGRPEDCRGISQCGYGSLQDSPLRRGNDRGDGPCIKSRT